MEPETLRALATVAGPLLGAGLGSYFGLKGALNGLRERAARIETTLTEVRDHTRDTVKGFEAYAAEGREAMRKIDRIYETGA